jgi:hypothetical protein
MMSLIKTFGQYAKNPYVMLAMLSVLAYCLSTWTGFVDGIIEGYKEQGRNEIRVECQAAALSALS